MRSYENHRTRPITLGRFIRRMALHALVALSLIAASLFAGMAGYMHFEQMGWRDAFLNASMILGGMGPVKTDLGEGGKVFAGRYALYSGLALVAVTAILLGPVVHRFMHKFHWDDDGEGGEGERGFSSRPHSSRSPSHRGKDTPRHFRKNSSQRASSRA